MWTSGQKLHGEHAPLCPGRGVGVGDLPSLKVFDNIDPSDIAQGKVGDCWLLSGISALAEFDGGIKYLFRKTPDLDSLPREGPNQYTVTLWDLPTWTEVVCPHAESHAKNCHDELNLTRLFRMWWSTSGLRSPLRATTYLARSRQKTVSCGSHTSRR